MGMLIDSPALAPASASTSLGQVPSAGASSRGRQGWHRALRHRSFVLGAVLTMLMLGMAAMLSDEDMKNVSAYLAQQKADPGAATDKDLVALGEKIYRGGIQDRNIASCAGCHSPNGAGIPAQYPRLSGQHAQYIVTQLNQFRDGTRDNNQQMTDVAAKLNDKEIKALGEYIAGLK